MTTLADKMFRRRNRRPGPMGCVGCGSTKVAGLWIDRDYLAEHDDAWPAPHEAVCAPCAADTGCVLHVRFPKPREVPPNMAYLLSASYTGRLRKVWDTRGRAARAKFWGPSATPSFRAVFRAVAR